MPEFILRVGTPEGDVVERQVTAASLRAAHEELRRQGLHVFEGRRGAFRFRDLIPRLGRKVSTEDLLSRPIEELGIESLDDPLA